MLLIVKAPWVSPSDRYERFIIRKSLLILLLSKVIIQWFQASLECRGKCKILMIFIICHNIQFFFTFVCCTAPQEKYFDGQPCWTGNFQTFKFQLECLWSPPWFVLTLPLQPFPVHCKKDSLSGTTMNQLVYTI